MDTATHRYRFAVLILSLLLFPFLAAADTATTSVQGGFPSGSVWISKTAPVAGDSVQIFAPIYDASGATIDGDVTFFVDGSTIGSTHFSLNAGEAKIVSLPWSAEEGTHTITAKIQNAVDGNSAAALSLSGEDAQSMTVAVAAAPPQPAIVQALGAVLGAAQSAVSASAPAAAAGGALYAQTEALRTSAQAALQSALGQGTPVPAKTGQVLGAETYRAPGGALAASASAPSSFSVLRILEEIALFAVSYQWVFYPLLILFLLAALYLLARQVARPRYTRGT